MTTRWQTLAATAAILALLAAAAMAGPGYQKSMTGTDQNSFRPQLHRADKLIDTDVVNRQGDELGEIEEIVLDPNRHTISYAVVDFKRSLDLDEDLHAIPWGAFSVRADEDGDPVLMLNVREDQLSRAKGFDDDDWPDIADARFSQEVFASFNTTEDRDLAWRREHTDWSAYNIPIYDSVGDYQSRRSMARSERRDRSRYGSDDRYHPRYDSVNPQRDSEANLWYLDESSSSRRTMDRGYDSRSYDTRSRDTYDSPDRRSRTRSTAERSYNTDRRYAGRSGRTHDVEKRTLSDMKDKDVYNQGEKIGEVDEIIVDTHAGALAYVVVKVDEDYAEDHWRDDDIETIAVPWHAVTLRDEDIRMDVQHSSLSALGYRGDLDRLEQRREAVGMHQAASCPTYWEVVYFVPTSSGQSMDSDRFDRDSRFDRNDGWDRYDRDDRYQRNDRNNRSNRNDWR